jgi:hypothetical protein
MGESVSVDVLRKKLGIKRLKKKIIVSKFEKASVASLRKKEKHRVTSRVLVPA